MISKKIQMVILIALAMAVPLAINAQTIVQQAAKGFDSLRANIPHGKIDTISYNSKTVGVSRKALIYTPPGFS